MLDTIKLGLANASLPKLTNQFKVQKTNHKIWLSVDSSRLPKDQYYPKINFNRQLGSNTNQLTLEFSAPKLLFGSNYYEVKESDLEAVTCRLIDNLGNLGISTTHSQIHQASVKSCTFCKNFFYPHALPAPIEYLTKLDLTCLGSAYKGRSKQKYSRTGYSTKIYNTQTSVSFYDKKAELFDKPKLNQEKRLVNDLIQEKTSDHVLRFEFCLQKPKAVKGWLNTRLNITKPSFNLKDIFNQQLAHKILAETLTPILDSNDSIATETNLAQLYQTGQSQGLKIADVESLLGREVVSGVNGRIYRNKLTDLHFPKKRYYHDRKLNRLQKALSSKPTDFKRIAKTCQQQMESFQAKRP